MSKYLDIKSYNLAVRVRSHKTILVEGTTDKSVISNFFLVKNHNEKVDCQYFIDQVSIISSDAALATLGNKQKIIYISDQLSKKNENLGYFIDREWDDFDFENLETPHTVNRNDKTFVTRGHSIENYWFSPDAAISFLQNSFPTHINNSFLQNLELKFPSIMLFAAAFSIAAKEGGTITKISDLLEYTDINIDLDCFSLKQEFNSKLSARKSNFDIATKCNNLLATLKTKNTETLQWICHGHLGEQAIRACVARLALNEGINAKIVSEIERGDKPGKFKHDSKHITNYSIDETVPLSDLLSWVRG